MVNGQFLKSKKLIGLFVILFNFILLTLLMFKPINYNQLSDVPMVIQFSSCLNNVYDAIFVISIRTNVDSLALTLYQLHNESVQYVLWEGHSQNNPNSFHIYNSFINTFEQSKYYRLRHTKKRRRRANRFYLHLTQMDIIHYAMHHQYKKILLLEDDILLGNPSWIEHFCNTEPFIPEWYILNIGENMFNSKNIIPQMYLNEQHKIL
eukprot:355850_1